MAIQPLEVKKLSPVIGAELGGVDLATMTDELFEMIHDALMEHQVIFFRDQTITPEQHTAFGQRFGTLHIHPAAPKVFPDHPEIFVIHADANSKFIAGDTWHSDVSCDAEPPMGSILYLQEVPETGGDTLFASMYAAYEALSESIQQLLCALTAVHAGEKLYRGRYDTDEPGKTYPVSEHPVVRTHPVTGRKALFVNAAFTTHIKALSAPESKALLDFLFDHMQQPMFQCRFKWEKNSIAFWDNRCVQHHALWDYYPQVRHGHRVTVSGDRPFYRP